jgi:hypothetical protein
MMIFVLPRLGSLGKASVVSILDECSVTHLGCPSSRHCGHSQEMLRGRQHISACAAMQGAQSASPITAWCRSNGCSATIPATAEAQHTLYVILLLLGRTLDTASSS